MPVDKFRSSYLLEDFARVGMRVRTVRKWGRDRTVIDAGTNKLWAEIVGSLLDDECFVEEYQTDFTASMHSRTKAYRIWYPAHYAQRLWADQTRRIALAIFGALIVLPAAVAIGIHFGPFGGVVGLLVDAILMALLVVPLAFVWWWLRYRGFEVEMLPYRFVLGLVAGVVWTSATGVPTVLEVVGAFWVFAVSNLLWMGAIGWDRQLQDERLGDVGGRLTWHQATELLQEQLRVAAPRR